MTRGKLPHHLTMHKSRTTSQQLAAESRLIDRHVARILAAEHGVDHRPGSRSDFCPLCKKEKP